MKAFISGAIRNKENFNVTAFKQAEALLEKHGIHVMNPIKLHPKEPLAFSHEDYLHVCFAMIDICDCVIVLPDSEQSVGSKMEEVYAHKLHKPVLRLEDFLYA